MGRLLSRVVVLAGALLAAAPAAAQEAGQLDTWCANSGAEFTPDLQLSACDALIKEGDANLNFAVVHNFRGQAYLNQQDLAHALEAFNASIAYDPAYANPYGGRADVYYLQEDYVRAVEALDKVVELVPDLAGAYYWRARNHVMLDDNDAAIADFSEAIRRDPTMTHAYWMRSQLYNLDGDYAHALTDVTKVIEAEPAADAYKLRGDIYYGVKDYAHAIGDHSEGIRLAPEDPQHWNARCWDRAVWGRELDLALSDCNKALELDPANAAALDSRGMVHLKRGDWSAAEADYDASARAEPEYGSAYYGRGIARSRLGRGDAAADLVKAVELDPEVAGRYVKYGMTP